MDSLQSDLRLTDKEIKMFIESERMKTFTEWPNDLSWSCTPEKLAKAGFFFNPSPDSIDNACCAFCGKELDGWEPDDDPLSEHRKHSSSCPFLSLRSPVEDLTVVELIKLNMKRTMLKAEHIIHKVKREYEEQAATTREEISEHVNTKN